MDEPALRQLLDDVSTGAVGPDEAVARLRRLPFADLGFARVDHHRLLRQGLAEAVYAPGKTPEQCAAIVAELLAGPSGSAGPDDGRPGPDGGRPGHDGGRPAHDGGAGPVILTRASPEQAAAALDRNRGGAQTGTTVVWRPALERPGRVVVVTAGTADLPVATECTATLAAYGYRPLLVSDCGAAGIHRLLATADDLAAADVVVVVAGMEGALATLVGGITAAPVLAVPTSVGYGAALEGVTALLAMLSSCAAGVTVVGIDNGFGAACAVARLLGP
jgi:NCAIR mutase (PurE)-related protein